MPLKGGEKRGEVVEGVEKRVKKRELSGKASEVRIHNSQFIIHN
jgi:hypothetical protein